MLLVLARSKCTVADWHIELLIHRYMRYRCCINERRSITVPWQWGPRGGRLRPRSVYNLPTLAKKKEKGDKKKEKRRVAPYCRITFQLAESIFQMFLLSCSLFLHSDLIWPRWKMMWRSFLFCTWHPHGRQRGSLIPNSSKVKALGTKIFWKQPRKNFKLGPCIPRKTELLIVTPSVAIKSCMNAEHMFRDHVLLY